MAKGQSVDPNLIPGRVSSEVSIALRDFLDSGEAAQEIEDIEMDPYTFYKYAHNAVVNRKIPVQVRRVKQSNGTLKIYFIRRAAPAEG